MRIGVYTGSFNPVHRDHVNLINHLLENHYLDKIIVIPTGNYWDKNDLVDVKKRIAMFKFYENDKVIIDDELNDLPFSYQILEKLNNKYFHDDLYLIIGADNLEKFYLWKNFEELLKNRILVLPRNGININQYIERYNHNNNFIVVDSFKSADISSTEIRNKIKQGKEAELLNVIDDFILQYIKDNDLYK